MAKEIVRLRKTYWGVLVHNYSKVNKETNSTTPIFDLDKEEGCCCSDGGYNLFNTKAEALDSYIYKNRKCKLVKFTTEIIC